MNITTGTDRIAFSSPDIREEDIQAAVKVLRSGWITTGPVVKELEDTLCSKFGTAGAVAFSSGTAALRMGLKALGLRRGDEVIVPAYTYTATAAAVIQEGAIPIMADSAPDSYFPGAEQILPLINSKTKAIIGVDLAGIMADYDMLLLLARDSSPLFSASNDFQESLGRICIIADGAHSVGASRRGVWSGAMADLTAFSFHAVKNITGGEGGALCWRHHLMADDAAAAKTFKTLSLHGQTKDAYDKFSAGHWEYDVVELGDKCNLTDFQAAIVLSQLKRLSQIGETRARLLRVYEDSLQESPIRLYPHFQPGTQSSCHLALSALPVPDKFGKSPDAYRSSDLWTSRDSIIAHMNSRGIAVNVHYKTLPMFSYYRGLGYRPEDYPNSLLHSCGELTLPLHTGMSEDNAARVAQTLINELMHLHK